MNHLMKKLDQLNLDIEEALSASSSPSDTPRTTSKKQTGQSSGMPEPRQVFCSSRRLHGNKSENQEDVELQPIRASISMRSDSSVGFTVLGAQASSLTQGHCLLLEADCDLRQLQSLSLTLHFGVCVCVCVCLSLEAC
ncbi:hypothetical protein PAMA_020262 [Pampus argenteus]